MFYCHGCNISFAVPIHCQSFMAGRSFGSHEIYSRAPVYTLHSINSKISPFSAFGSSVFRILLEEFPTVLSYSVGEFSWFGLSSGKWFLVHFCWLPHLVLVVPYVALLCFFLLPSVVFVSDQPIAGAEQLLTLNLSSTIFVCISF